MTQLYRHNLSVKYKPFLDLIANCNMQYSVEVGCGAGNITRLLMERLNGPSYTCIDVDSRMLELTEKNVRETNQVRCEILKKDITASLADVRKTGKVLVHSHGVLEHFEPTRIKRILANLREISPRMVHYVPGARYGHKSFGDERLWTKDQWREIANPDDIVEFNRGFDYALVWHR